MGGKTRRGFCPDCGSPIVVKPDSIPQFVAIRTASLDDPSWFNPQVDVWTSDAHPWDQMNPALPKFIRPSPRNHMNSKVLPIHKAQLLSYMKLLDIPIGLLINFHELKLTNGVHRFILAGANNVGEIEQELTEETEAS